MAPDPAPALPNSFNGVGTTENSGQIGIYEFFDDLVLAQLVTDGLAQNQELKIRNQEIYIASNDVLSARGAYLPFVSANARGGFERTSKWTPLGAAEDQLLTPNGGNFSDPLGVSRLSANLFWRIDIWRQYRNARDSAQQRFFEAVERRNYLITQLVAETAENYYELAALDKRLVFLDQTIELQEQSLEVSRAQKAAARGTELAVQRFLAEVRKNQSQRLIVQQRIIEVQNRINFLVGRFPQHVERANWDLIKLNSRRISVGVPAQLLLNRRDIQAAEREMSAAGLDILVARAEFFPKLDITATVGFESFNPKYLFDPEALIGDTIGDISAPLINKSAIRAQYMTANARQLQTVYDYQRTVLNAFIEVTNNVAKVENYRRSVEIKLTEVNALEESVGVARNLFKAPLDEAFARVEYVDVLLATRDLLQARTDLIETKQQQLTATVRAYQALGGGYLLSNAGEEFADLFCGPVQIHSYEVVQPHEMMNATNPSEGLEMLPPPAEQMPLPPANP
ncbi:TolC family protein [Anatilimnocola sp. NA78]|uniref:TolC family protein n=1 Tax=Anatilimnocola sp. NA78 TaxID=3415683 RepID=UPI003CE48FD7